MFGLFIALLQYSQPNKSNSYLLMLLIIIKLDNIFNIKPQIVSNMKII